MKPHMNHIAQTLIKKEAVSKVSNQGATYENYKKKVSRAFAQGYTKEDVVSELYRELELIMADTRTSDDPLIAKGFKAAKLVCVRSINLIISELKGEK